MLNEVNNKSLPLPPKKDTKWEFGSHKGIKSVRNINMQINIVKFPIFKKSYKYN